MANATFGERLDRWLLKKGFRAELPLLTLSLIEMRRMASAPGAHLRHRRDGRALAAAAADYIDRRRGYRLFGPDEFEALPRIVAAGEAVFAAHRELATRNEAMNKRYFYNLLTLEDLAANRVLLEFALSENVAAAVAGYLGQAPRLHSLGVFYSSVNDTIDGSQIFHIDGDSRAQVKCFVNIWGVDAGSGPFTFVPKDLTSRVLRHGGLLKSMDDEAVRRVVPSEQHVTVVGPPGAGVFVDTSRCLHQGSRARTSPRLVFQFQYVSRPDSLLAPSLAKNVTGGHIHVHRDLVERLGLANARTALLVD